MFLEAALVSNPQCPLSLEGLTLLDRAEGVQVGAIHLRRVLRGPSLFWQVLDELGPEEGGGG